MGGGEAANPVSGTGLGGRGNGVSVLPQPPTPHTLSPSSFPGRLPSSNLSGASVHQMWETHSWARGGVTKGASPKPTECEDRVENKMQGLLVP